MEAKQIVDQSGFLDLKASKGGHEDDVKSESKGDSKELSDEKAVPTRKVAQSKNENTDVDALLRRAVSSVYADLVKELAPFFEEHYTLFDLTTDENKLEYMDIFKKYEALVEAHLERFSKKEGFDRAEDMCRLMKEACSNDKSNQKMVDLLVASTEYKKFIKIMKLKAKKLHLQAEQDE